MSPPCCCAVVLRSSRVLHPLFHSLPPTLISQGTTYTNKLIQSISQTTTATNYGVEQSGYSTSIPIKPNLTEGPFFRFPKRNYSKYILTKTHCGACKPNSIVYKETKFGLVISDTIFTFVKLRTKLDCSRCSPERYIVNAGRFGADCRSGNKLENGKQLSINQAYSSSLVKKAVHIIRNPFNNIVSRLRYQHKTWADRPDREEFLRLFQADQQGFRRWCQFLDYSTRKTFTSDLLDNKTKELYPLIPCPAEFYRYVQWHNLATEITEKRMRIPVLSLFYENYTESYNDTVNQLLDFLELEAVSDPSPFIEGKEYPDYFTDDEKYYAGILAKHLATTKTWSLIGHYFENFMDR